MRTSVCVLQRFFHRLSASQADASGCFPRGLHGMARFCCAVLLCVLAFFPCAAQSSDGEPPSGRDLEAQYLIQTPDNAQDSAAEQDQPSSVWLFVRMVLVLALVVGCIYLVVFFMKKSMRSASSSDPYLKVVASLSLSPGKSLCVVTLNSAAYLVGVTDSSVNLVAEVQDKELIDAMNLNADRNSAPSKPRDFASVLRLFNPQKKGSQPSANPFSGSTVETLRTLQKQRERLNSLEEDDSGGGEGT